ncbi:MAG: hypothetical protein JO071_16940 [Deltaproteobacteria bacterium]|nr:hypothetical protein [Deltaproteobacteria bacterium]
MVGSPLLIAEQARARLRSVVKALHNGLPANFNSLRLPSPADVMVTPCEVVDLHGTGILVSRIFREYSSIISLRTSNFYDVPQTFGAANFCLPLAQMSRRDIDSWVKWWLNSTKVRRVICLPYLPADPLVALSVKEMFGVPLCTYIMDDKNVCAEGISDALMEELLAKSSLRLVISPEMRAAYEEKYCMKFWLVPPLVLEELVSRTPMPVPEGLDLRRGVLIGNVWGQRWLDMLRATFRGSSYQIDWYCNQKNPRALVFDRAELEQDGIRLLEPVLDTDLPAILAKYSYAIMPSDTLDGQSPEAVQAIAELSLPSRIPFVTATSHLPIIVLGSPKSAAARFVTRFGLGEVAPYETDALRGALDRVLKPESISLIRKRSAEIAGSFSVRDAAEWIWRSLAAGQACDLRYERLMPPASVDLAALQA